MTKQQENRAFVKMLKEFPKAFGRVSFRERLMLRAAFTYVIEEVFADIKKENEEMKKGLGCETCQIHLEYMRLNYKIMELEVQIEKMKCCQNCDHYRWSNGEDWCNDHYGQPMYDEECKDKWELKE